MAFIQTPLPGLVIFEPRVFRDARGHFFEIYSRKSLEAAGIRCEFMQDNQSRSRRRVVRGLHYQNPPFAQAKLVRVVVGQVLDVAVDIRRGSPTFGRHFAVVLSAENRRQLFIPRGFAHGFVAQSEVAELCYKCDNDYSREHEGGILWNDPTLGIDWGLSPAEAVLSEKDAALPPFAEAVNLFRFEA